MDFSLSSSLVGNAVSNTDKLSLDLQFATDKTLTARKGPNPVFTRGSTGTFVGDNGLIQTSAVNIPRFDHNPISPFNCKGLLIEESRTNDSWYSGAIVSGTGWLAAQTTSVVDGVGPDGNNAYTITEDTATNVHAVSNTGGSTGTAATAVVSGTTYTGSIFLKKVFGSVDWVQLLFGTGGFGSTQYANFNLNTGTVGNSAGLAVGSAPKIEAFANGWYRCSITATATATTSTSNNLTIGFVNNINGTTRLPSYAGSTASKVLAAMCQFETGAFPTSYIPTVAASAIRSVDVCSISGGDFTSFYNTTEGSFATSSIFNAPATFINGQVVFDINDTTTLNRTRFLRNATNGVLIYANNVGGVQDVAITSSTAIAANSATKISGCMKANDFIVYLNNVSQGVDTTATMQSAPTTFTIGDASLGLSTRAPINGTIASIRYYKKRLSNAKLQALTV